MAKTVNCDESVRSKEERKKDVKEAERRINKTIGKKLEQLRQEVGISQSRLADLMCVAEGSINNYLSGESGPSAAFLARLLTTEPFDAYGLYLDDLINESPLDITPVHNSYVRKDIAGCYLVYYFDQSREYVITNPNVGRTMRYGVIALYEMPRYGDSEVKVDFKAFGKFFKDIESASKLHKDVTQSFSNHLGNTVEVDAFRFESVIRDEFLKGAYDEIYEGSVDFKKKHIYVDLSCEKFSDHALFALYKSEKKDDKEYVGGVASLSSVSRGRDRCPCAQKALISKYRLSCSDDKIAKVIRLNPANFTLEGEGLELFDFFTSITTGEIGDALEEWDKRTLFNERLERLIQNYIEKNLYSVGVVTSEDDSLAYELFNYERLKMQKPISD